MKQKSPMQLENEGQEALEALAKYLEVDTRKLEAALLEIVKENSAAESTPELKPTAGNWEAWNRIQPSKFVEEEYVWRKPVTTWAVNAIGASMRHIIMTGASEAENEANARLCAVAPEMRRLLEVALPSLKVLRITPKACYPLPPEWVGDVETALDKSYGIETPKKVEG